MGRTDIKNLAKFSTKCLNKKGLQCIVDLELVAMSVMGMGFTFPTMQKPTNISHNKEKDTVACAHPYLFI